MQFDTLSGKAVGVVGNPELHVMLPAQLAGEQFGGDHRQTARRGFMNLVRDSGGISGRCDENARNR